MPGSARSAEPSPAGPPLPHARVIAVIPAHDEAPRIRAVVTEAARHVPVLVVDDGSSDDTAAVARTAGASVIEQRPNQGKGAALRAGFRQALDAGVEAVITLDADGQHDPTEIPALLAAGRLGTHETAGAERAAVELVIGRRDFRAMPLVRRLANATGTVVLSASLGRWIPDNQSGYRRIGRRLMAAMLDSRDDGFAFEVEMLAVCVREGWPMAWLPIRTIYGAERSHIRPLRHLRDFLAVAGRARAISRGAPLSSVRPARRGPGPG
jgi:glycosyltransferase involved in cell wall biosynthesis